MADNLSQKSHKTSEKNKYNNVMHRTTSESLRLNDTEKGNSHPTSLQSASHNTRKISSFQITSVTVGSRVSTDAGEDSADDLDESHTDDISRITDLENETPSFSEDTFSKDDVFYNASSASLGCAPVIPTSSQYGLAIVGQDGNNPHGPGVPTLNNTDVGEMHVSVTNSGTGSIYNIIGNPKPAEGMKEIQEHVRNERFKVVKIESTEPFRRGRWMCMDYLDHTTTQPSAPVLVNNNVDCQTETSTIVNVPDSGVVLNDGQHEDPVSVSDPNVNKPPAKDLQLPNTHQHDPNIPHSFPIASPGQSLTQPINMMQTNISQNQPASVSVQSPPIEIPQQISQSQAMQGNVQQQAQSMSHIAHNPAPPTNHNATSQPQAVQQMPQSFPSHQLQQVIAQSQGLPQMQQMQMHQQLPPQQMQQIQNQQAQIQQMQGQHMSHNASQMPNIQQLQQMPQMQQLQNQGQIQQMPGQQNQIQQIQMQQMTNQQVSNQPLHQMHPQQAPIQNMPQQAHHMQNQQPLPNQQPQMQHLQNQTQMHPMQTQQSHQIPSHMQQMQQMPQMNSQGQGMPQMHNQTQMHQMTSQQGQVNNQGGQVQQQHSMHPQLQQQNMGAVQHNYNNQPGAQAGNPQNMMQQQPQHMPQQTQVSQPLVQPQHNVPQYYQQQSQLTQQGQSLTQEVMANIVNSQQGATLPSNLQSMSSQPQGSTLPANLQGLSSQQNSSMHPINQAPQNTIQMMSQAPQNIPMSMDSNQSNMQIPVSDPIYMQTSNVNQQIPMNQHMGAQQAMLNQQVSSSPNQGQSGHISQQSQIPLSHVMPSQQAMNNQPAVPNQGSVMSQTNMSNMQNVPVQQNQQINQQMPQVSNVVQQPSQPMMQNMVPPNQQNVIQHGQNIPMSMQQNHPGNMQGSSVHSVPTSVVQSQTSMHPQVGMPIGGFNSQGNVGSIPQNVMPAMSQTNMTATMGMQNVNNSMDIHITQQNICSTATASQPVMSGTNSPVVSLPVSSGMNYAPNPGVAPNTVETQNFGSPVNTVVSHVVNSLVNSSVGLSAGEVPTNDSGGGTPATDCAQLGDINEGKEDAPAQNTEENESASGASAVAIDNKIEQAMDLVKSHLMFAVREEVEVLKEKIAELMERINQLELENSLLRSHASQDTLAQLSAPAPAAPAPPSGPVA